MSDTYTNIADSARAGNDARTTAADFDPEADAIGSYDDTSAAIGPAVRNGAPVPTASYFKSGRSLASETARPLNAYSERDILSLIGDAIGPPYPVGSASRWHRRAGSVGEKRIAESVASIVHSASGADPLARRVAIAAARAAAGHAAAPLTTANRRSVRRSSRRTRARHRRCCRPPRRDPAAADPRCDRRAARSCAAGAAADRNRCGRASPRTS